MTGPELRWVTYSLDDHPVGYIVDSLFAGASRDEPAFRTRQGSEIVINRLGHKVPIRIWAETDEDAGGRLTRLAFWMSMSGQAVHTHLRFDGDSLRVRQETGGRSYERAFGATVLEVLGPEGIRMRSRDRLRRPGDRIVYHTFAAELGMMAEVTRTADSLAGGAIRVREGIPGLAERRLWLGADGRMTRLEDVGPFVPRHHRRRGPATALAAIAVGALPEETIRSHRDPSNVPVAAGPGSLTRSTVRLPRLNPVAGLDLALRASRCGSNSPTARSP